MADSRLPGSHDVRVPLEEAGGLSRNLAYHGRALLGGRIGEALEEVDRQVVVLRWSSSPLLEPEVRGGVALPAGDADEGPPFGVREVCAGFALSPSYPLPHGPIVPEDRRHPSRRASARGAEPTRRSPPGGRTRRNSKTGRALPEHRARCPFRRDDPRRGTGQAGHDLRIGFVW